MENFFSLVSFFFSLFKLGVFDIQFFSSLICPIPHTGYSLVLRTRETEGKRERAEKLAKREGSEVRAHTEAECKGEK